MSRKIEIAKDELINLYINNNLSIGDLSRLYGCCKATISKRLNEYGIKKVKFNITRDEKGRFVKGSMPFNKGKKLEELFGKDKAEKIKKLHNEKVTKKIDLTMNENLAYILGVLLGDGYVSYTDKGNYIVGLEVTDKKFADEFIKALNKLGLKTRCYTRKRMHWKIHYCVYSYSKQLYKYVKNIDYNSLYDELTKDINFVTSFLKGFYESEGSDFKYGKVILFNSNTDLIKFISKLIVFLGFKVSITYDKRKNVTHNRKMLYKLSVLGNHKEKLKFINLIKPIIKNGGYYDT